MRKRCRAGNPVVGVYLVRLCLIFEEDMDVLVGLRQESVV
jgi:hypothetical protein